MNEHRDRLQESAAALGAAAEQLAAAAGDRLCAPHLPAAIAGMEQSLRALDRGCSRAASSLIRGFGDDDTISDRYARAAADWPLATTGVGPSYERQAQLLAALDDAGAALRAAAGACARAGELLAATVEAPAEVAELRDVTARAA
jgi:hypothetical protein